VRLEALLEVLSLLLQVRAALLLLVLHLLSPGLWLVQKVWLLVLLPPLLVELRLGLFLLLLLA
jgi:hypothetical protein